MSSLIFSSDAFALILITGSSLSYPANSESSIPKIAPRLMCPLENTFNSSISMSMSLAQNLVTAIMQPPIEDNITNNVNSMTIATSSAPLTIGREYIEKEYLDGIIDEVRISNIARSYDWILTEYANQNEPSSFYSIGESVRLDFNAPSVVIDPSIPSDPYGQNQTYKEVKINATITDAETGVLKAIAMIDGDGPFNITMNQIAGRWTGIWDNVSEYSNGDYRITIWVIDEVGNINQKEEVECFKNQLEELPGEPLFPGLAAAPAQGCQGFFATYRLVLRNLASAAVRPLGILGKV